MQGPILKFKSKIKGKNADVELYQTQVSWKMYQRPWWVVLCSLGLLRRGRFSSNTLPLSAITSVSVQHSTFSATVKVAAHNDVIYLRTTKGKAGEFAMELQSLKLQQSV